MAGTAIRPQPGPQTQFLRTPADIAIFGGAAGGGKSWSLLLEPLRHINNPSFGAVIFRRTYPQVTSEGALWDQSAELYPLAGGTPRQSDLEWRFPSGARIKFAHMQYETNRFDWQGSQIPLIAFDELTHFSEAQFVYMLSRNRSLCGVRPYVRASCNPDAESWVARWVEWWIGADGYALPERSGLLRYFVRSGEQIVWADTPAELLAAHPGLMPKSVTFILSTVYDNPILLEKDPGYLANLQALPLLERERLLGDARRGGNWHVRAAAGKVFNRDWFEVVETVPEHGEDCRFWDFAGTEKQLAGDDPDFTAGVLVRKAGDTFYVVDCINEQAGPARFERLFAETTAADVAAARAAGRAYRVRWEIEPGSAAVRENRRMVTALAGIDAKGLRPQGDKLVRARPLAVQAEVGNVKLLRGAWNEAFRTQLHHQPDWPHDDMMDAAAGAFAELAGRTWTARSYQG